MKLIQQIQGLRGKWAKPTKPLLPSTLAPILVIDNIRVYKVERKGVVSYIITD